MTEMININGGNSVTLCGSVAEAPAFSHVGGGENYMTFPMEIERLSGALDRINIVAREADLESLPADGGQRLRVEGELRSFNNKGGTGSRLVITVFARTLSFTDEDADVNDVRLSGVICKPPTLRKTPMGRQICDIMLAVNRRYGRSDYLPCIAWGRCALDLSARNVGDSVDLIWRIQSRKYIKNTESGAEERTAFEVSVISLEEES